MAKQYETITKELEEWIGRQKMFFVATAPLAAEGLVNCSPKGTDTFRVLGPREVAYLDLTGSGIETTAHLRENGRIVVMFCAFEGRPNIVRLHGMGEVMTPDQERFEALRGRFPNHPGIRSVIVIRVTRISDSCGYAVPLYEYRGDRDMLHQWAETKGPEGLVQYRAEKNRRSVEGLPGMAEGEAEKGGG